MHHFPPQRTGVYRLRNGIEIYELKFEVRLRALNSLLPFPMSNKKSKPGAINSKTPAIKLTFGWQEKLLSSAEVAFYRDASNCITKAQKKYHKWVQKVDRMREKNQSLVEYREGRNKRSRRTMQILMAERQRAKHKHMLFTYINSDGFVPDDDDAIYANANNETLHHKLQVRSALSAGKSSYLKQYQVMYVYADLKPDTELVRFLWDPNEKQLFVYPDFCQTSEQFYYKEIISSSRRLYAYSIANVTQIKHRIKSSIPHRSMGRFYIDPATISKPSRRTKRVLLLLQLNTGENFQYNNIYVRYHMKFPEDTYIESGLIEASTQRCWIGGSRSQMAHFSHHWEVVVTCEELYCREDLLYIYFEVISTDSWGRERDEGYAVYSCPLLDPLTTHEHKLQCVRPLSSWPKAISRFFFGGCSKFDYETYLTHPRMSNDNLPSETHIRLYDNSMQKTGELSFTISKLKQSFFSVTNNNRSRPLNMNLEDILRAYHEAQAQLEEMIEMRKRQQKEGYGKDHKFTFESL